MKVLTLLGLLIIAIEYGDCKGYLTVIAPKSIQSNSEYRLSIAATEISEPINVNVKFTYCADQKAAKAVGFVNPQLVSIPDPSDLYCQSCGKNEFYVNWKPLPDSLILQNCTSDTWDMENNVTLSCHEKSKTVVFHFEDIAPGSYVLEVTSLSSSLEFSEKIFLYRESYTLSVLIETDKPVYKAGDVVKFRVLVLDFKTQPIPITTLTVAVSDASQNRVQVWNGVSTCQGVYSNEYEIEAKNDINLGLWQIEVEYKDKIIKKTIEVTEYVLPKFKVEVETSNCMHVCVKATYYNGKPVAGLAIIKATPILSCSGSWKKISEPVIKTVKCVRNTEVVFEKSDFVNQNFVMLLIEVSVQEKTTGAVVQGSEVIIPTENTKSMTNGRHNVLLQAKLINQPNLHKNIKIKVTSKEKLSHLFYYIVGRGRILLSKEVKGHNLRKKLIVLKPTSAMAPESQLVVYYVSDNGTIVSDVVKLVFADQISNNFIQLKVCNNKLKPGEKVEIRIKTKPNSFVGLLAVDVRSKFKAGNDLTRDRIVQELKNYENFGQTPLEAPLSKSFKQMVELGTFVVTNSIINGTSVNETCTQLSKHTRNYKTDEDSSESEGSSRSYEDKIQSTRRFFPETWLWQNIKTCKKVTVFTANVPDSITTWQLTAFSINEHGLALTEQPILLTVSQNFFVSVSLPYSVVRGEKLEISLSVRNYFETSTHVKLRLHNKNNDFEVLEPGSVRKLLSDHRVVSTSFRIIPTRVGKITIEITASSSDHDCDTVHRVLLVKPEGVTVKQQNQFILVVDNNQKSFEHVLNIPENIVNGSLSTALSVKGDTSSLVLNNLEQFSRPIFDSSTLTDDLHTNLILLQYLQATKQSKEKIEELLVENQEAFVIQRTQQCWDGGFGFSKLCHEKPHQKVQKHRSHHHRRTHQKCHKHERRARSAEYREQYHSSEEHKHYGHYHSSEEHKQIHKKYHGHRQSSEEHEQCIDECHYCNKNNFHSCHSKKHGIQPVSSTLWTSLPGINLYYFNFNNNITKLDKKVIDRSLKFMSQVQACNGSFVEFDKNAFPGFDTLIVLISQAVVTTFLFLAQSNLLINDYNCTVNKGLEFLSNEFDKTDDLQILTRMAVIFLLADHPKKDLAKQRLDLKKTKKEGSLVWSDTTTGKVDSVLTALGLQASLISGDIPNSQRIGKGLIVESQVILKDTIRLVSSFNVLPFLAEAVVPVDPDISIYLTADQECGQFVKLTKTNQYLEQKINLPSSVKSFNVSANGTGLANFWLTSQYNLPTSVLSEKFMLNLNLLPTYEQGWTLQVCSSFQPVANMTQSKRVTVDIDLPVGCSISDNILTVGSSSKIKAFDLFDADRLLKVQLEGLDMETFCFDVQFTRVSCVAIALPSKVMMYENDKIADFAQKFYTQPLDDVVYDKKINVKL